MSRNKLLVASACVLKVTRVKRDESVDSDIYIGKHSSDHSIYEAEPSSMCRMLPQLSKALIDNVSSKRFIRKQFETSLLREDNPIILQQIHRRSIFNESCG